MTYTQMQEKWETKKLEMLRSAYARGFCNALEKDVSLDEACDAGDMAILNFMVELNNIEPEERDD